MSPSALPTTLRRVPRQLLRTVVCVLAVGVLLGPLLGLLAALCRDALHLPSWRVLFLDTRPWGLFLRSLLFSGAVATSALTLGTLAALLMKRYPVLGRMFLLLLPALIIVPPYLLGVAWTTCFFTWNTAFNGSGASGLLVEGWLGAWWVEVMALLPLATGFAVMSLESINPAVLEAARLTHAEARVFARIGLPLAWPLLAVGGGFLLLISLMDYSIPSLFATNVYAMEIFSRYSADGNAGMALLTALPLLGVLALLLTFGLSTLRQAASTPAYAGWQFPPRTEWPLWWSLGQWGAGILVLAQVVVPTGMMLWLTGSPAHLLQFLHTAHGELTYTLALAGAAIAVGVPLALFLAGQLARPGLVGRVWWLIILAPLVMPASLVGIGMAHLVNLGLDVGINLSRAAPLLVNLARFLPVAALICYAQRLRCDPDLLDAARLYQHSVWHGMWRVVLPIFSPGLLLAALLLGTFTLSELGATLMVAEPGSATLMMRLYNLLHYGASQEVAALCLVLMSITLGLGLLATGGVYGWRQRAMPRKVERV